MTLVFNRLLRLKKRCESEKADARIRTADPFITSEVLYQLSYVGAAPTLAKVACSNPDRREKGDPSTAGAPGSPMGGVCWASKDQVVRPTWPHTPPRNRG
jgi:hypothetical protein